MRKIPVKVRLIRDYLQHRRPTDKETIDQLKKTTKILQRDPDNDEAVKCETEASLYRDEDGLICIPSLHLEGALIKAGVSERMQGRGKKTYKDTMKAFVEVEEQMIPLKPQTYEIDRRWVVINRSRILRSRPLIPKGATAEFNLNVFDDTLPIDILQKILDYAGTYVGIGDYRPKFGLFEVVEFNGTK